MLKKNTTLFLLLACVLFVFLGVAKPAEAKAASLDIISAEPYQNFVKYRYESDSNDTLQYVLSVRSNTSSGYTDYKTGTITVEKGKIYTQNIGCSTCGNKRELKPGDDVRVTVGNIEAHMKLDEEKSSNNSLTNKTLSKTSRHSISGKSPWPPKSMTVEPEKIARETTDVTVTFDKGYVPAGGDQLLVNALDADGKTVDTMTVELDSAVFPVQVTLTPKSTEAAYEFVYNGAKGNESKLSAKVAVTGEAAEPGFENAAGLKLEYASLKLKPGAAVAAPKMMLVDKNGKTMPVTNAAIAIAGDALEANSAQLDGSFKVKADAKPGSTVSVTAVSGKFNATVMLTVEGKAVAATTATPVSVSVNKETNVILQMQEDGKNIALGWKPKKAEVSVSGVKAEAAIVDVEKLASDGMLTVRLKGTEAGNAQIDVTLTNKEDEVIKLAPAKVALVSTSALPPTEKHNVTMYINKMDMHVDGKVITMDTMPIIQDNRTFVPFRSLAQAFGANVDYDDATRSITTKLDDKTIVMTIGQKEFTVNGKTETMDVAPFIDQNNRTMVPVRFIAQALGFSVTPIYDANGATQSVLFGNSAGVEGASTNATNAA